MPDHDDDLATELRALAAWIDVPEAADQRARVRARLTRPRPARRPARWAVAALAAVVAAVAAIAPARAAVVGAVDGLLRVAGIEIRREPPPGGLPARPSPLPSLRSAVWEEARRAARFPLRLPAALGTPDEVLLADPDAAGAPRVVTLTYRGGAVRFDQFEGEIEPTLLKSAPDAEVLNFGPQWGIWLPRPHPVTYVDRDGNERTETARLAGPVLIWTAGDVTYRLEGMATPAEARAVALSLE